MGTSTTLKALRTKEACYDGYNKLVRSLQGREFSDDDQELDSYIHFAHNEPISLAHILESNGIDEALWSLRACEQTPEMKRAERLFAVWCARQVQHLMTDQRSINALDVAERFANGDATEEELVAARNAPWGAARNAPWGVARDAARGAPWAAVWAVARNAAWGTARDAQSEMFKAVFCGEAGLNVDALYAANEPPHQQEKES